MKDWEENELRKLKEWRDARPSLFGTLPALPPKTDEQLLRHFMRCLSRGRVPPVQDVVDTLNGKPVPLCGYIGCLMEEGHVH